MPDGPIISAETALASLRDAGYERSPEGQFAHRALAGKFVELFDPNLPVADFDGNVSYGGVVTIPAAGVADAVDKGFIIITDELRLAIVKRDEAVRDVEREARAEMVSHLGENRDATVGEEVLKAAKEATMAAHKAQNQTTPPDERVENMRPPHEAAGPAAADREVAGTDEDKREEIFELHEKVNEEKLEAEKEGLENPDVEDQPITVVTYSQRDEMEARLKRADGAVEADQRVRTGSTRPQRPSRAKAAKAEREAEKAAKSESKE